MSKIGVPVHPTDPMVAKQVHDDIWDMFGTLTREQSVALISYLESLTAQGVLVMPKYDPTVGTAGLQILPGDTAKANAPLSNTSVE